MPTSSVTWREAVGLGRPLTATLRAAALGLGLGIALVAVLLGALALAGAFQIHGRQRIPEGFEAVYTSWHLRRLLLEGLQSLGETAIICFLFLGVLRRYLPLVGAVIGAALLFGALHFSRPHVSVLALVSVSIVVGLPVLALFVRLRSFWAAAGFHFAWNILLGTVFGVVVAGQDRFGVLDSVVGGPALWTGGAYGVEGSLSACLINGLACLLILRRELLRPPYP